MSRLVLVAFFGAARSESADHAHESPGSMKWPLVVLAIPSLMVAWLPLGPFLSESFDPAHPVHLGDIFFGPFNHNPIAAFFGFGAALFGFSLAYSLYWKAAKDPLPTQLGLLSKVMRNRFYFDEIYETIFISLHNLFSHIADWIDRWVISGLMVRGVSGLVNLSGRALRLVQTGNIQSYTFFFTVGVLLVVLLARK